MPHNKRYILIVLSILMLVSCKNNDTHNRIILDPIYRFSLNGNVVGEFSGEVQVYDMELDKFEIAKTYMFNGHSVYSIEFQKPDAGPVIKTFTVELNSGFYNEVADDNTIDIIDADNIQSVISTVSAKWNNITYLTSIASGLTTFNQPAMNAITSYDIQVSNQIIANYVGFDIDSTGYIDYFSDSADVLTDKLKHSMIDAGISQYTFDQSIMQGNSGRVRPYTTADFITLANIDIQSDGKLDGIGPLGADLFLGSTKIDANTYRHSIPVSILKYMDNPLSKIVIGKIDILDYLVILNDSVDPIFGDLAVTVIDEGGPTILNFLPADGSTIVGDNQMSAQIEDITGIPTGGNGNVEFLIDDVHYTFSGGHTPYSDFAVVVFQNQGTIGNHTLTIKVTNNYGTTTTQTNTVTFDNR